MEQLRKQIDDIDHQMLVLLAQRLSVVRAIGSEKKKQNMNPLQPTRWNEVITDRMARGEELGISPELIMVIWQAIHAQALLIEGGI